MSTFAILLLCFQACLIQAVFGQCGCGGVIQAPVQVSSGCGLNGGNYYGGLGASGLGYNGLGASLGGYSNGPYNAYGNGQVSLVGDFGVNGATNIAGQIPTVGITNFAGAIPAYGGVTISGGCGYPCSCGCY